MGVNGCWVNGVLVRISLFVIGVVDALLGLDGGLSGEAAV
jgi:hypothetical protein